jgi:16S rRNA (guanine527-N7)-methyltransferase
VSDPAVPSAPPALIADAFGDHLEVAQRYVELLLTDGVLRGLIGPREAERVWERHLANSATLAPLIPHETVVVDIGSGAGLPGIPLAIARPDLEVVLLEPLARRVSFLRDCLAGLALAQVSVAHQRAEDGVRPPADVVVARAVAPLDRLIALSFDLLVDSGVLLALKGRSAASEVDQVRRSMRVEAELMTLDAPGQPATVVRVRRPTRPAAGTPSRRPAARHRRGAER